MFVRCPRGKTVVEEEEEEEEEFEQGAAVPHCHRHWPRA